MRIVWDDLDARARGLATHLLGRVRLERLAAAADLATLAGEIQRLGYGPMAAAPAKGVTAAMVDRALRRGAGARLRTLERWCGDRALVLAVLFEDEDRRSLRALLRGAVAGAAPEARLAGLIPTPALPARALEELARQQTTRALAALLVIWRNPYGPVLLEEAGRAHPDLRLMELALNRRFAGRALETGRRGGRALLAYVREVIDIENASTAIVLAGGRTEMPPADGFLPGGRHLRLAAFLEAVAAADRAGAVSRLARAFAKTPLEDPFRRAVLSPGEIESWILQAQIGEQARAARLLPLGPAPLLHYVLRLRAEVVDLRSIAWGLALGAPPVLLTRRLVSAP